MKCAQSGKTIDLVKYQSSWMLAFAEVPYQVLLTALAAGNLDAVSFLVQSGVNVGLKQPVAVRRWQQDAVMNAATDQTQYVLRSRIGISVGVPGGAPGQKMPA